MLGHFVQIVRVAVLRDGLGTEYRARGQTSLLKNLGLGGRKLWKDNLQEASKLIVFDWPEWQVSVIVELQRDYCFVRR